MKKDLRPPVPKKVLMPDEAGKMIAAGSEAEKKQVADFRKSIADEQFDMLNFTAEGQKWLADQEPKSQSSQMDMFNKMYQRRMMMMCVMPLTRGLNSDTIIQSVGMYVGMSLVNKEFREATQKTFHNALGNLYNVAANNIESEKWRKKLSPEKREAEVERLKAFRDKHLAAGNDGRVPYSPESAAMTDLKLSFEAYKQMCANRNDPDKIKEIQDNFASARETLHLMAKADGVSPEEISQNVRVMVGKMSDYHPEVNYLYSELTSGGVEKADFYDQKVARFDEKGNAAGVDTIKVWTGEYVDKNGDAFEAPFTPRVPMSDKDFLDATQDCLGSHWAIGSAKDLQDLSVAMNYVKANIGYSKEDVLEIPDEIKSNPNVVAFSKEMLKQANGYYLIAVEI